MLKKNHLHCSVLSFLILLGAYLGFDRLMARPLHFDEGVNGYWVQEIWQNGFFKYDPTNFHGPLYFYILQLSEIFFSFQWQAHRAVTVLISLLNLFGIYSIGKFLSDQIDVAGKMSGKVFGKVLGLNAAGEERLDFDEQSWQRVWQQLAIALCSSLFWLASPGALYYSRYSIHETLLVGAEIFLTLGALRFFKAPSRTSVLIILWSLVVMSATKETFVIFLFALAVSLVLLRDQWSMAHIRFFRRQKSFLFSHTSIVLIFWVLLFSGFGKNLSGLIDFFRAFLLWFRVGIQDPAHLKPAYYWGQLILENEPLVIFSVILSLLGWAWRDRYTMFFSILGLVHFLIYSLIGYKTPWCLLGLTWPWALVTGCILMKCMPSFSRLRPFGALIVLIWFGTCIFSLSRARSLSLYTAGSESNSYAYVQSSRDLHSILNLISWMQIQSKTYKVQCPQEAGELWPLPWVLSRFNGTTCFNQDLNAQSDLIILQADAQQAIDLRNELEASWPKRFVFFELQLRDGTRPVQVIMVADLAAVFKLERHQDFGESRQKQYEPKSALVQPDLKKSNGSRI